MSVTAASASLNSLEPPRSILGARDSNGAVTEYFVLVVVLNGCEGRPARTPMKSRGRQLVSALRDKVAEMRRADMLQNNVNKKIAERNEIMFAIKAMTSGRRSYFWMPTPTEPVDAEKSSLSRCFFCSILFGSFPI
jgi:hypothetical protein